MRTIPSRLAQLATLAAAAWIFTGAVQEEDRTASVREVEQLRGLVKSLEKKVATLESRIHQMENRNYFHPVPPSNLLPLKPGQPGFVVPLPKPEPPKIWGKGEYNGWPYYIIPVQER